MKPVQVHIIDDDDAVRDSLRLLLHSVGLAAIEYSSAQQFLDQYDGQQPGCVVLDICMPGMGGLELQQEMNQRDWRLPVIVISAHGDIPMAVEAMREGAISFLQKPVRDEELLSNIREAIAVNEIDNPHQTETLEINTRYATLTNRERNIARRIVQGQANKVIAMELGIGLRTVELSRASIIKKMGARSVAELVQMMIRSGTAAG